MGADVGLKAQATGVESRYVSTVGRTATVAPGKTGLLVTQNFGFEHRKRAHVVLLPSDGKLLRSGANRRVGPDVDLTELIPSTTREVRTSSIFGASVEIPQKTYPSVST